MLAKDVKYIQLEKVLRTRLRLQLCRVIRVAAAYEGRLFQQTRVDKEPLARSQERSARHTADFRVQTEGVRDAVGGTARATLHCERASRQHDGPCAKRTTPRVSDQVIRENPASRGTEASAEELVGPPWWMVSNVLSLYLWRYFK